MVKKLNQHLLENYPLIWNMRLLPVVMVIIIFHLFHLLVGYSMYDGIASMGWHNPGDMFFATSFSLFSIIGSFVIFILWLTRVLRNNAFKSFYPFSNNHLFLQFLIILGVCLGNLTYYYSYTSGYLMHARNNTNNAENERDVAVFNSVAGFLQSARDQYSLDLRCHPYPFPLTKQYKANAQHTTSGKQNTDEYYYESRDKQRFTQAQVDSIAGGYQFSYLNWCSDYNMIEFSDVTNGRDFDYYKQQHLTLLNDPKMLKQQMAAFTGICRKYGIHYKLDVEEWFRWVYNPPYYPVQYTIFQIYYSPGVPDDNDQHLGQAATQTNPKGYYVELQKLQYILQNTRKAHEYRHNLGGFCGFLYAALGLALLVFTFRATPRRVWIITLIGSALIALILGAITAVLAMGGAKDGILAFYVIVIFSFLFIHIISESKTISGVSLNWFVWSFPFLSLLLYGMSDTFREGAAQSWMVRHSEWYFFLFVLAYLLTLWAFIIPRFRHWQSMPED